MKAITAIIQPHMLDKVMAALHALPHFPGVTVSDCHGQGRGRGPGGHYQPDAYDEFYARRTRLEIWCNDAQCDALAEAIQRHAYTGNPGDGMVLVADLQRVIRIRTGQQQQEAT